MNDYEIIRSTVEKETTQDSPEVRGQFLECFKIETHEFIGHMSLSLQKWQNLESMIHSDVKKAHVASLVYSAINLHMLSFKLFLSGYPVASGNLQRQTIETIALALLCSHNSIPILDQYMCNKYKSSNAMADLKKYSKELGLNQDGVKALEKGRKFYHNYSHPTQMTIAEQIRFGDQSLHFGACFDTDKVDEYRKEVKSKVSLAHMLINVTTSVAERLARW
jgi:hypothetical protein